MKNWIIVLLIFVVPLGVFAWLESGAAETKIAANTTVQTSGKGKLLKFSSPMCSDCKKVTKEMATVIPDYKDSVTFEEINVSDGSNESLEAVKTYKITVVPTMIFVNKNGQIVNKAEGFLSEKEIRSNLEFIK